MWNDPFTVFGDMSIPIFSSNLVIVIIFALAAYFALKYTRSFYQERPIPQSWILIVSGLLAITLSEIGQFVLPYILEPVLIEAVLVLMIQSTGIILVTIGCYLLYKEIP